MTEEGEGSAAETQKSVQPTDGLRPCVLGPMHAPCSGALLLREWKTGAWPKLQHAPACAPRLRERTLPRAGRFLQLGRRPLLLSGVAAMVAALLCLGISQGALGGGGAGGASAWVSVLALLLYVGAYQCSFGPISWLIVGEVRAALGACSKRHGYRRKQSAVANGGNTTSAVCLMVGRPAWPWLDCMVRLDHGMS